MIDTPGFGDDLQKEERTIDALVDVLKNDVRYDIIRCNLRRSIKM